MPEEIPDAFTIKYYFEEEGFRPDLPRVTLNGLKQLKLYLSATHHIDPISFVRERFSAFGEYASKVDHKIGQRILSSLMELVIVKKLHPSQMPIPNVMCIPLRSTPFWAKPSQVNTFYPLVEQRKTSDVNGNPNEGLVLDATNLEPNHVKWLLQATQVRQLSASEAVKFIVLNENKLDRAWLKHISVSVLQALSLLDHREALQHSKAPPELILKVRCLSTYTYSRVINLIGSNR